MILKEVSSEEASAILRKSTLLVPQVSRIIIRQSAKTKQAQQTVEQKNQIAIDN